MPSSCGRIQTGNEKGDTLTASIACMETVRSVKKSPGTQHIHWMILLIRHSGKDKSTWLPPKFCGKGCGNVHSSGSLMNFKTHPTAITDDLFYCYANKGYFIRKHTRNSY